nr:hypothetical protein [Tanacetum cinerariifolium]
VVVVVVVAVVVIVGICRSASIVVDVVVVGICMSASTVPGQMANPFAIIAPRLGQCSASYSAVDGFDCFLKYPQTSVCSQQHHRSSYLSVQWQIQLLPALFFALVPSRYHESCRGTSSIFNLSSCCAVADIEYRLHCLKPLTIAATTPRLIKAYSYALVIVVAVAVGAGVTSGSSFSLKVFMAMPEELPE